MNFDIKDSKKERKIIKKFNLKNPNTNFITIIFFKFHLIY